jgi:hypothetical protein
MLSAGLNGRVRVFHKSVAIFCWLLFFAALTRPLDGFNDINNILNELSPAEESYKLMLLYPLKHINADPAIKLLSVGLASTLILSIILLRVSKTTSVSLISLAFLLFSLQPLILYHYRQYLGYALAFCAVHFYLESRPWLFRLCSVLAIGAHPIFATVFLILLVYNTDPFARLKKIKFSMTISPLLVVGPAVISRLLFFLVFFLGILMTAATIFSFASSLFPGYAQYSNWDIDSSMAGAAIAVSIPVAIGIALPFFEFKDDSTALLFYSTYGSLCAVTLFQLTESLYAASRLGSSLYPIICYCMLSARISNARFRYIAFITPACISAANLARLLSYK